MKVYEFLLFSVPSSLWLLKKKWHLSNFFPVLVLMTQIWSSNSKSLLCHPWCLSFLSIIWGTHIANTSRTEIQRRHLLALYYLLVVLRRHIYLYGILHIKKTFYEKLNFVTNMLVTVSANWKVPTLPHFWGSLYQNMSNVDMFWSHMAYIGQEQPSNK